MIKIMLVLVMRIRRIRLVLATIIQMMIIKILAIIIQMRIIKKLVLATVKMWLVWMRLVPATIKLQVVRIRLLPVLMYVTFGRKKRKC